MALLILTTFFWFFWGWSLSRYLLQVRDLFTLLPLSLGLGLTLQLLLLNGLLYQLDSETSYWVSVGLLSVLTGGLAWVRYPLASSVTLGVPVRSAILTYGVISFVWLLTLPALLGMNDLDANYHYNFAGLIAAQGLPLMHPWNPDLCSFYHYGGNLLVGVLFKVSGVPIAGTFDWVIATCMWSIMGLGVNVMWWIHPKRSLMAALVGLCIFLFATGALWVAYPLQIDAVREAIPNPDLVTYLDYVNDNELAYKTTDTYSLPSVLLAPFVNMYHTRSLVFSTLVMFMMLVMMLRIELGTPAQWGVWVILGVLLGSISLFYETLWTVPIGMIVMYALYRAWEMPTLRRAIFYQTGFILLIGGVLGLFQGGAITDYVLCGGDDTNPDRADTPFLDLTMTPSYYSLMDETVVLTPDNWVRWLVEWGLMLPLTPVLVYHFAYRRRQPLLGALMINLAIPIFGMLFTENIAGFLQISMPRFAYAPLGLATLFVGDWIAWERQRGLLWRIGLVLIFIGLCWAGWLQFIEQITAPRGVEADLMTNLEARVNEEWFGKVGGREDVVLNLRPALLEDGMGTFLGNYTLITLGRVNLTTFPYIWALRDNPHPDFLNYYGIDYVYFNESWWSWAYPAFREQVVNQPDRFEQVFWVEEGEQLSALYRVLPSPEPTCEACQVCVQWFDLEERPLTEAEVAQIQADWRTLVGAGEQVFLPFPMQDLPVASYLTGIVDHNSTADPVQVEAWRATKAAQPLRELGLDYLLLPRSWFIYASEADLATLNNPAEYESLHKWDCPLLSDYLLLYRVVQDE